VFRRQHVSGGNVRGSSISKKTAFRAPYRIRRSRRILPYIFSLAPVQYDDSATVYLSLIPSSVEFKESVDSATVRLSFTPSGIDFRESLDSATVRLTLTPDTHDCIVSLVPAFEASADRKWQVADPQRQWLTEEPFRKWTAVISESPITC
jgi:hypothetical protein